MSEIGKARLLLHNIGVQFSPSQIDIIEQAVKVEKALNNTTELSVTHRSIPPFDNPIIYGDKD